MIKSVYSDQTDIIKAIMTLCGISKIDVDLTYGNGQFYKSIEKPNHRFDLDDSLSDLKDVCSSDNTPLADESVSSVMFDPPFLTYVRNSRTGNGSMVTAKRFSGYWRYNELEDHYIKTIFESARILRKKAS